MTEAFRPLMSAARAERIRQWHEAAYQSLVDRTESHVDGVFDLIVFDPPFRWFSPRDVVEAATTDTGYAALTRFFRGARNHLADGGRMLVFFGSSGDLSYLRTLIERHDFHAQAVASHTLVRDDWQVEYHTFRLTA